MLTFNIIKLRIKECRITVYYAIFILNIKCKSGVSLCFL